MADPVLKWPLGVLTPASINFSPRHRNTAGSRSISGMNQDISSGAGGWVATYKSVNILSPRHSKLYRAIQARLQGRLNSLALPIFELRHAPFSPSQPAPYDALRHSDSSLFSDGSGYYQTAIVANLTSPLARGATAATIDMTLGAEPEPGHHFSIGVRLYRIRFAELVSPGRSSVVFWPPAREAASSGTTVEFERPVCKMKLASDNEMDDVLEVDLYGFPDLKFIEDVT